MSGTNTEDIGHDYRVNYMMKSGQAGSIVLRFIKEPSATTLKAALTDYNIVSSDVQEVHAVRLDQQQRWMRQQMAAQYDDQATFQPLNQGQTSQAISQPHSSPSTHVQHQRMPHAPLPYGQTGQQAPTAITRTATRPSTVMKEQQSVSLTKLVLKTLWATLLVAGALLYFNRDAFEEGTQISQNAQKAVEKKRQLAPNTKVPENEFEACTILTNVARDSKQVPDMAWHPATVMYWAGCTFGSSQ